MHFRASRCRIRQCSVLKPVLRRVRSQLLHAGNLACLNMAVMTLPAWASFDVELYAPFVQLQDSVQEVIAIYDNYYGMPGISPDSPLPDALVSNVQGAVATLLADYEDVKSKMIGRLSAEGGKNCRAGFEKMDTKVIPLLDVQSKNSAKVANGYNDGFRYLVSSMAIVAADFVPDCIVGAQIHR